MNFRCFKQVSLKLSGSGRIFVGENAQGKTSLLEAVCLLLRLQSPRARQTRQLIREGANGFGISGDACGRNLQVRGDIKGLGLRIEGEKIMARRDYLSESGLVVWMGNEDLDLVRGGGESRRRFLDFIATQVDPDYRLHWNRYRRALAARNKYLKSYSAHEGVVDAYTKMLIEHGSEMIRLRQVLCEKLSPCAIENQKAISRRDEELGIIYKDRSNGDLEAAFKEVQDSETRRGITLAGPHRDDVKLEIAGRNAKAFGSEGQQRTVALALKLAQGEILRELGGHPPIYLIDDVFGELDPRRRNALMNLLPTDTQKLVTTTNLDWWDRGGLELGVTTVKDGELSEE